MLLNKKNQDKLAKSSSSTCEFTSEKYPSLIYNMRWYRHRHRITYTLPRLRTKFGKRAFSHAGPAAWNALPENIRANQDCDVFRKQLKTYFSTLAFNVHW